MNIMVTGGAGYIGSVIVEQLLERNHKILVVDNLQQGHIEAISHEAKFIKADICDNNGVDKIFEQYEIDTVVHLAGETVVEYSMTDPKRYFHCNILGGMNILNSMCKHKVNKIIYSSTAAVYGLPKYLPIDENHPKDPVNAYGESKLIFEHILEWYAKAYGFKYIILRYFNAAGASEKYGEAHHPETHLIPIILKNILDGNRTCFIFGNDYPTKDGSCVRDYVHVLDIAEAHCLALEKIDNLSGHIYNLGTETGCSVIDVIETAKIVTGEDVKIKIAQRRTGDPPALVAKAEFARKELGWVPRYNLEDIIESAWKWLKNHPHGYN